jgi:hypothetical protein
MIPLLQHLSNVYDLPVHDFKDFPTSFPLGNPPLQNVQPFNPTEIKKTSNTDKRAKKAIQSVQKAAVQRSKREKTKILKPTKPLKSSYIKSRHFLKPVPFEGDMQQLSSTIYSRLIAGNDRSALLGRVVSSQTSSRRFYQPGELFYNFDTNLLQCDWLECAYRDYTFPAQTHVEVVKGAPLFDDEFLEAPMFLFSQNAWEKGSLTMLPAKQLIKSADKPEPVKKRRKNKIADVADENIIVPLTDQPATKKLKTTMSTETEVVKVSNPSPTKAKQSIEAAPPASAKKKEAPKKDAFDINKRYPCQWDPKCKSPARYCGEGARLPKHCANHRQPSANLDFYELKGRGGFPFDEKPPDEETESDSSQSDGSDSESDNSDSDSS